MRHDSQFKVTLPVLFFFKTDIVLSCILNEKI